MFFSFCFFFFSSRRRHTRCLSDWSSDVCSSDLYYTSDIISIHEAYPGHYVQFLRLNASPASKVEKIFGSYAFIEGWAQYCEKMMIDEGYGSPTGATPTGEAVKRAAKCRRA